jgi:hypothetical protein
MKSRPIVVVMRNSNICQNLYQKIAEIIENRILYKKKDPMQNQIVKDQFNKQAEKFANWWIGKKVE